MSETVMDTIRDIRLQGGGRRVAALGLLLALPAIWLAVPVRAAVLYRCTGVQGEAVFASQVGGYRHCRRLGAQVLPTAPPRRPGFQGLRAWAWSVSPKPAARPVPAAAAQDAIAARLAGPVPPPVLRGAVYRIRRADGSLEYTNLAPARLDGGRVERLFTYIVTCMACSLHSPIHWQTVPLQLTVYAGAIEDAGQRFGVDTALLRAVIHAESAFNPRAISLKGAQGLMQLMPATASEMGVADAFDASQNIHGGARYLAQLLRQFHGDVRQVAAAYDAGAGAVLRYGGVPPYAETQVYVQRVELLLRRYRAHDGGRAN